MNEISNFCNGECTQVSGAQRNRRPKLRVGFDPNNPPYDIDNVGSNAPLNTKTLDMDAQHYGGVLVYNAHNLFGKHTCINVHTHTHTHTHTHMHKVHTHTHIHLRTHAAQSKLLMLSSWQGALSG